MKGLKTYFKEKKQLSAEGPIIYTRVSISRNIAGYRFEITNSQQNRRKILSLVKEVASGIGELDDFGFYNLGRMGGLKRNLLVEENIISEPMLEKAGSRGVMVKLEKGKNNIITSIMINEEDHLKIQGVTAGLGIREVFGRVSGIEKKLEQKLNFAFDRNLGYLTSSPTLVGSGLEVSVMAHLPALVMSFNINDLIKNLNKLNCTLQGYHIQDSEVLGNMFLVSKESSLERNDIDTVEEMEAICLNIIDQEKQQAAVLKKEKPVSAVDNIGRSYGVVKHARLLSFEEAIELLSMLKLGQEMEILDDLKKFDFYYLINIIGNSYIRSYFTDKDAAVDEVDRIRANILRKEIFIRE
ncbi:MAG: hypothetical protein ACQEP5_02545 [Actinomycetota bacterium]